MPPAGKPRHIPLRMCVTCRTPGDKRGLLRVVRLPNGVQFDATGKAAGRGAYVCAAEQCILTAQKQKRLDRSLKAVVSQESYAALLQAAAFSVEAGS